MSRPKLIKPPTNKSLSTVVENLVRHARITTKIPEYVNIDTICAKEPPFGLKICTKQLIRRLIQNKRFLIVSRAIRVQGTTRFFYVFPNDPEFLTKVINKFKLRVRDAKD